MGYPGKSRKMYARPRTPWQAERIAGEVEIVKAYGLRNKREVWKAQAVLRKYRQVSRSLLAAVSIGQVLAAGRKGHGPDADGKAEPGQLCYTRAVGLWRVSFVSSPAKQPAQFLHMASSLRCRHAARLAVTGCGGYQACGLGTSI